MSAVAREPWDQQPGERPSVYQKFRVYLDQPAGRRSVCSAQHAYSGRSGRTPGSWHILAKRWRWEDRALAYDRAQDRAIEARLVARRMAALEATAELGELLRKKAMEVARLLTSIEQHLGERDGREVILLASVIRPADVCRLAEVGVKLEQLALGGVTDRLSVQWAGMDELAAGLDDVKRTLAARLREVRQRVLAGQRLLIEAGHAGADHA
jgi:hypothetical protein